MNHLSVKTKIFFRKIIVLMTTFGKVFQIQDMEMRGYFMTSLLFFKRQDCRFCSTQWENGFENKSIAFPLIEMKIYLNFTPMKVENCQAPPPFFFQSSIFYKVLQMTPCRVILKTKLTFNGTILSLNFIRLGFKSG